MTGVGALLSWGAAAAAAAGAAEGAALLAILLLLSVSLLPAARLVRQSSWYLLLQKRQWVSSLQQHNGTMRFVTGVHRAFTQTYAGMCCSQAAVEDASMFADRG